MRAAKYRDEERNNEGDQEAVDDVEDQDLAESYDGKSILYPLSEKGNGEEEREEEGKKKKKK